MKPLRRSLILLTALAFVVAWGLAASDDARAQMVKDGKIHIIYANTYQPPWPSTQVYSPS